MTFIIVAGAAGLALILIGMALIAGAVAGAVLVVARFTREPPVVPIWSYQPKVDTAVHGEHGGRR